LQNHDILSQEDWSYLEFEYLPDAITIVKRQRKLNLFGKYLTLGGPALTVSTDMRDVQKYSVEKSTKTRTTGSTLAESLGRGGPKVQTNPLKTFSGDPIDYEDWVESLATLCQTVYKPFMDQNADVNRIV
jgi:hypothetical protein